MNSLSKIVCVGWNYRPHITETDAILPKEPIIFIKPPSCIIHDGDNIVIPEGVTNVQHEVELALIVGKRCKDVPEQGALEYISHVAVFNDITARDMQTSARDIGNPWSLAKGMDTFGPISEYVAIDGIDLSALELTLDVNGERKQIGHTKDMIFTPEFLISYISRFMTLEPGDIIATGTPEGISEIVSGDVVCASIDGIGSVTNTVA
ncbi:MAG: fumarylacetoacetate hydrolase family protein [Candidatus Methanomethylophilaceae archaeon]|nr:fumarylacetoacetate hydrolase family protein [Candidatus Methanomethylophilaceae archaeon]MBO7205577.1 fumarylacetoacetate hydrolase family protein [Candidatus Methanomethylophilaceae archaeon]